MGGEEKLLRENAELRRQLASRQHPMSDAERENMELRQQLAGQDSRQDYSQPGYREAGYGEVGHGGHGHDDGFTRRYDEASHHQSGLSGQGGGMGMRGGRGRGRSRGGGIINSVLLGDNAGQGGVVRSVLREFGGQSGQAQGDGHGQGQSAGRSHDGGLVGMVAGAVNELSTTFTKPKKHQARGQGQERQHPFESSSAPSSAPLRGQSAQSSGQVHNSDANKTYKTRY